MTKNYALLKLLEHGPLTPVELYPITGWGYDESKKVARELVDAGEVVWIKNKAYALAGSPEAIEHDQLGAANDAGRRRA